MFGAVEVVLARELTKQFEEVRRGTPAELLAALAPGGVRGEVTLVLNPRAPAPEDEPDPPDGAPDSRTTS